MVTNGPRQAPRIPWPPHFPRNPEALRAGVGTHLGGSIRPDASRRPAPWSRGQDRPSQPPSARGVTWSPAWPSMSPLLPRGIPHKHRLQAQAMESPQYSADGSRTERVGSGGEPARSGGPPAAGGGERLRRGGGWSAPARWGTPAKLYLTVPLLRLQSTLFDTSLNKPPTPASHFGTAPHKGLVSAVKVSRSVGGGNNFSGSNQNPSSSLNLLAACSQLSPGKGGAVHQWRLRG